MCNDGAAPSGRSRRWPVSRPVALSLVSLAVMFAYIAWDPFAKRRLYPLSQGRNPANVVGVGSPTAEGGGDGEDEDNSTRAEADGVLQRRSLERAAAAATGAMPSADWEDSHRWLKGLVPRERGLVELHFMGRLGNNLFEYAAARTLADRLGYSLTLQPAFGKPKFRALLQPEASHCFPGIRPLGDSGSGGGGTLDEAVMVQSSGDVKALAAGKKPGLPPRHLVMRGWFQDYSLFASQRDHLRRVMSIRDTCCSDFPGPQDVVVHYRNYRAELTEHQYATLHFKDLGPAWYDAVLGGIFEARKGSLGGDGVLWVVGEASEDDPLVQALQDKYGAVLHGNGKATMLEDFCFMARAPTLVIAQSTFSWWAAFLGNASQVHFPLQMRPGEGSVTTARTAVLGDHRYVYHAWDGRIVNAPAAAAAGGGSLEQVQQRRHGRQRRWLPPRHQATVYDGSRLPPQQPPPPEVMVAGQA